jgi:MFS transporter, PAT family, beta-lactamase induction signal transducer AmpG
MKYTDKRIAASMFSILMAVTNIAQGVGMAITGISADNFGFRWTFIIVTFINLIALPLLPVVFARENRSD